MGLPTFAWGKPQLFKLPDGAGVYGQEFDLLPAGTMFAAHVILHGLVGMPVNMESETTGRVDVTSEPVIYAVRGTNPHELAAYESDILHSYQIRSEQGN